MKLLLFCLAMLAAALPAGAQTDTAEEAERGRIAAERNQADARLAAQEVACYKTFAVNDCLTAARSQRRERLSDLRRQELSLNEAQRKRRSADRLRSIEERNSAQKQEDVAVQREEAVTRQQDKKDALARRSAEREQSGASAPARAVRKPASHDSAEQLRRSQQRQQDAQERRDRVAKRLAEAARSGARPLPVPP